MTSSPLFSKVHDLQLWLLQAIRKFPREQRFQLAQRLYDLSFALHDTLVAASMDRAQTPHHLLEADIILTNLRKTIVLCLELELFTPGQFRHLSVMTTEVGNMLGAWRKKAGVQD